MSRESLEEKETARLEAFSDGIFAFAITLLVLNLKDPVTTNASNGIALFQGLWNEWPIFFAFLTSFATILIMWVNHHNMFNHIRRIDRRLMFLNGLLLLFVTLTPFTTSLIGDHILSADSGTAAAIYSGSFLLLSFAWNGLWLHAAGGHRLLGKSVSKERARTITRQYYFTPLFYVSALIVSFYSGLASVAVILAVAGFYAVTASMGK